jgi:FkbM family methyltransferase
VIVARIRKIVSAAKTSVPMIGWKWFVGQRVLPRLGISEIKLKPKGLPHSVYCRFPASDIYEYTHLLGWAQIPFNLPINPRYVVDAGANVGYSALRFLKEFPEAQIVAIEPEHENVTQLRKNCRPYPRIAIEEVALWSRNARLRIKSLDVDQNAFQVMESADGNVIGCSVEEIMKRHNFPRIDVLKIDIEGSEKVLFADPGSRNWLRHVKIILIETHDRFVAGCTDAINDATAGMFEYTGVIDEYACYVSGITECETALAR